VTDRDEIDPRPPTDRIAMPRGGGGIHVGGTGLIDLAARRLGGMVLEAGDEFFAAKENLLEPKPPVFDPHRYSDRGKEMDGWETRRRRDEGHDSCLVRLGVPGVLEAVIVDTSHFRGNFPAAFALEGVVSEDGPPPADAGWTPLLERTELRGDEVQRFDVEAPWRVTHVRFSIFPDGGVARLRLLGRPLVDLHRMAGPTGRLDLVAAVNGGRAVACSDEFFSSPHNLIMVGDARDMGDGWETKRRRGPGEDWAVLALASTGLIDRVEIDTTHFKGNYPDRCVVEVADAPGAGPEDLLAATWTEVVPPSPMQPHARHRFDIGEPRPATHLRLRVLPDGGVARLRAFGTITDDGWREAGLRMLDARLPAPAAEALRACCGSSRWVDAMVARRPFASVGELRDVAGRVWDDLGPDDHREAFAAHPRIGERSASGWSSAEQAGAASAEEATLRSLEEGNRAYEERFGHVFLIRAAGRSAEEMLAALEERLGNDADTELRVAAEQQRQITERRLDRLLREGRAG
jgi:allantoicase